MNIFPHHSKCTPNYPEKPKGEPPQLIVKSKISDNEILYQCVDCGAHILTKIKGESTNAKETNSIITRITRSRKNTKR